MRTHDLLTKKLFNKINLKQIKTKKGFNRVKNFYDEKTLKLKNVILKIKFVLI